MPEEKNKAETVSKLLSSAVFRFVEAGIDSPEFDAKLLMQHACGFSNVELISKSNEFVDDEAVLRFWSCVERRLNFEPVHRILGYRGFYGRDFLLSDDTLIPRPDTETLVEAVLETNPSTVLEIGTGSGVIAVSLAAELKTAIILATDISTGALETASQNACICGVEDKIKFVQADLFDGIEGTFDVIVSNPPYILSSDIIALQKEVRFFDPVCALDGGEDGLDFYRKIFEKAYGFLKPRGKVCVEIGIGQEDDVLSIAKRCGFSDVAVIKDLNHINRVVIATQ